MYIPPKTSVYQNASRDNFNSDSTTSTLDSPSNARQSLSESNQKERENNKSESQVQHLAPPSNLQKSTNESIFTHTKVFFGEQKIDLKETQEPIFKETFKTLMDDDPVKPFFSFGLVHTRDKEDNSKTRLYSAESIARWFEMDPDTGDMIERNDPCTRDKIEKVEYYLYMKGQKNAIHVGDDKKNGVDDTIWPTKKYLVWSEKKDKGDDEHSNMMCLLSVAFLNYFGCSKLTSNDKLDTSDINHLDSNKFRSTEQERADHLNSNKIYNYIVTHISNLIKEEKLNCSDPEALLTSIKDDAANEIAEILVELDPSITEDNDDISKHPHVRKNKLKKTILENFFMMDPSKPNK